MVLCSTALSAFAGNGRENVLFVYFFFADNKFLLTLGLLPSKSVACGVGV